MLPTLINEFDAVAIRVQHVGSVVARVIVEPGSRCAIVGGSRCDRGCVGRVDLITVIGYEADMYSVTVRNAFTKPEEQATVCAETFEIRVPRWPILAVEIKTLIDTKRR